MNLIFVTISIFFLVFRESQCSNVKLPSLDVYWRDYTGSIPDDAIPGGYDENNIITYIGQGFVKDRGVISGVVRPGVKEMTVPAYGSKTVDGYVKILCSSNPDAFKWLPTTTNNFNSVINNYNVVKGGEEGSHALYIGRVAYQGEVITGKIYTGTPQKAPLYFVHKNKEIKMDSYEVLVSDASAL